MSDFHLCRVVVGCKYEEIKKVLKGGRFMKSHKKLQVKKIRDTYQNELVLLMNHFLPILKLARVRVGFD